MADKDEKRPIIIIKKKSGGHGGHHGGAWKVAYADFVTAMMAFFLLLWLLNATSQEQKLGISNYFEPIRISPTSTSTGSQGILGGKSIRSKDKMESDKSLPVQQIKSSEENEKKQEEKQKLSVEEAKKILKEDEKKEFKKIEEKIKTEISGIPELQKLSKSLIVEQTEEGLRIQITDRDKFSMFPNGSSMMYSNTKKLVELVSRAILPLPNKMSISGYTDAAPYASQRGYTNWELSSDRANACRRVMNDVGIANERIRDVVGHGENDPLDPSNPTAPNNRRIAITLLWMSKDKPQEKKTTLPKEKEEDISVKVGTPEKTLQS